MTDRTVVEDGPDELEPGSVSAEPDGALHVEVIEPGMARLLAVPAGQLAQALDHR